MLYTRPRGVSLLSLSCYIYMHCWFFVFAEKIQVHLIMPYWLCKLSVATITF